jgi:ABC-type amino acid transport substrate-binding protein
VANVTFCKGYPRVAAGGALPYVACMNKHQNEIALSSDPMTKIAVDLARAMAERSSMNKELLVALAHAVAANEKAQRKFRNAVLIRLSRIDAMLTEVQGAQLAEYCSPGSVTDEQRAKFVQEVEERVSRASDQLGLKMVRYIYGESEEPLVPRDRRRKWSDWEI